MGSKLDGPVTCSILMCLLIFTKTTAQNNQQEHHVICRRLNSVCVKIAAHHTENVHSKLWKPNP